jgi:hypothetical protein
MAISFLGAKIPLERGDVGYLAGTFPDGITTVEGIPVSATVRVLVRNPGNSWDGFVVMEVVSAADGTWRVDGLNPALKFDVVGRKNGHNDVIVANVSPSI